MALPPEVCIRGAGIVGRALALMLARERVRVALVGSASPAQEQDVRAYALNAASRSLLESLRGWPAPEHVAPVRAMDVKGDAGGRVQFDAARHGVEALAWIVDVPALEQQLADAIRFQPRIESIDEPVPAPLTVVCEGRMSGTREALGVSYEVTPYSQTAIAARLDGERAHEGVARQWFGSGGDILGLLPMHGQGLALVWSVPQARAPGLLAMDDAAFCEAVRDASEGVVGLPTLTSRRAAWPLQRAIANRWTGTFDAARSWALAGDAAHTVHPLAGQGLNLGLADVQQLADIIHSREYWRSVGDLRLLRRYERARRADVLSMSLATDGLQQLFAQTFAPLPVLRNWGMKGFDHTRLVKDWVARQAMGLPRP